jgi:hypothetical protein
MYLEKNNINNINNKIDEWCIKKNISISSKEKDFLITKVYHLLNKNKILSFDDFTKFIYDNELEQYKNIDFNDEIISIEEINEVEMIDFSVSGNKLFFADNILTHNSATNNIDDADNANVSDSMGTVMTADFMLFLLQNEEMKEQKEIVCKVTKNRFAGRTDTWRMGVDYEHMRFHDLLIQDRNNTDIDIADTLGLNNTPNIEDEFGIIASEKQKKAEEFSKSEVKNIIKEDIEKINESNKSKHDKKDSKDPFDNDMEKLFSELGL